LLELVGVDAGVYVYETGLYFLYLRVNLRVDAVGQLLVDSLNVQLLRKGHPLHLFQTTLQPLYLIVHSLPLLVNSLSLLSQALLYQHNYLLLAKTIHYFTIHLLYSPISGLLHSLTCQFLYLFPHFLELFPESI